MPSLQKIVTREELEHYLDTYQRKPFQDILAILLEAAPSPEILEKFAKGSPAKWALMVKLFSQMAGYSEKTEATVRHAHLHYHQMSDAELHLELRKMMRADPTLLGELEKLEDHS